jgi:hypothetical protein
VTALFALVASGILLAGQGQAGAPKGQEWNDWDYRTFSSCVMRTLDDEANRTVDTAVRNQSTVGLDGASDLCMKELGLGRPNNPEKFRNAVAATSYHHAGKCAALRLGKWTVAQLDGEIVHAERDPDGYVLPQEIKDAVESCKPAIFRGGPDHWYLSGEILKALRYARKTQDQLTAWKTDPKYRSPQAELALCIVEKNNDAAVGLIDAARAAGDDLNEGRAIVSKLLPEAAKPCADPYPTNYAVDAVMTPLVNFFLASYDKPLVGKQ